jgi:hypothetical protein
MDGCLEGGREGEWREGREGGRKGGGGREIDRDYQELCSFAGLLHYRMATRSVNGYDFNDDACPLRASVRVR